MARKHRNPSFPTGLVIGAVLGAGALVWWATRKTTTATLRAMNAQPLIEPNREYLADGSMAYADTSHPLYNPPVGSTALTPAQIAAITANPSLPLTATEQAYLIRQRAAAAAAQGTID